MRSKVFHSLQLWVGVCAAMHEFVRPSVTTDTVSDVCPQGFCLPADMTDEMEGEGATQFEDIEGGGMGEGEGAKDVSDQIETEDQVRGRTR